MPKAMYECSGCGRRAVRRGFLNHIRQSRDPRCASARDRLQPTYPSTHNQETPSPSLEIDIEMFDASNATSTTPPEEYNQSNSADTDIEMSHSEDDGAHKGQAWAALGAPNVSMSLSSSRAPVVFDSDEDDSDDDGNQDQMPRIEGETPGSPRSVSNIETEQTAPETERTALETERAAQASKFIYTTCISRSDQISY